MKTYSRRRYTYVTDTAKKQLLACSSAIRATMKDVAINSQAAKGINAFSVYAELAKADKADLTTVLSYASGAMAWEEDSNPLDYRHGMWDGSNAVEIEDFNRTCRNLYAANMMWLNKRPVLLNSDDRGAVGLYGDSMWTDAYAKYAPVVSVCAFGFVLGCPPVARVVCTRTPYAVGRKVLSLRVFAKDEWGSAVSWVHLLKGSFPDMQEGQLVFLEDHINDIDQTPLFFTCVTEAEAQRYELEGGEL